MPRSERNPGTRSKRERGAYGNARGIPDKQARRARVRQEDPRYQAAMRERAAAEARLNHLGGEGPAEGAAFLGITSRIIARIAGTLPEAPLRKFGEAVPPLQVPKIAPKARGAAWTLGQARSMLRSGYRIDKVIERTGWGPDWFDDLPISDDGYGIPVELWDEQSQSSLVRRGRDPLAGGAL